MQYWRMLVSRLNVAFMYSAREGKRSIPRRHTIVKFQNTLEVGHTRWWIRLAWGLSVTALEAWRHWRNVLRILTEKYFYLGWLYGQRWKCEGVKRFSFFRNARSQHMYLPWTFSLETLPTQGHKPRRKTRSSTPYSIQNRKGIS